MRRVLAGVAAIRASVTALPAPLFLGVVVVAAVVGGATAAVAGFGIGSLLTPLIALRIGTPAAIAVVALPHAIATALRAWRLRAAIDWAVLRRFGLFSAAGAVAGGLLYASIGSRALTVVLGALLVATAIAALSGWTERLRPQGAAVVALGGLSGFFGGIAGNQGGLRAAALLAFGLTPAAYVATSTATGLLVDAARVPIYLVRSGGALLDHAGVVACATAGVVAGTLLGERILFGLSPRAFRRLVALLVAGLGVALLIRSA